ncbi:MAG: cellulase family glycosylhydrolase [Bacteroidales bacterium]
MKTRLLTLLLLNALLINLKAQSLPREVIVDSQGIMRWSDDQTELHGLGVNYTLPFAHEYRMAKRTGIQLEEAIRQDVYHMARLDLDLYRVHVWDTEISDTLGNLINNEHLRLFDFTISEMKKRGMMFIITPIAYWGNGWPESDEPTPGFSAKYGKDACLTDEAAINAQANYLAQFMRHVNSYTGVAYKDEQQVIGFEISNEPHHSGSAERVTFFINRMVSSIRQTGCSKLIFYNMSHSIRLADAYLNANVQGGTFQWYPTGLVANHQVNGNFLPHVEQYSIPFAENPKFKRMAKIVYEFDPADAGGNIMYTAMARTFRQAGMQLAAQFAYDATCWAPYNTNYGTHFMNLVYAPHKAVSLKIASAVFHTIPLYKTFNDKNRFDDFRISYKEDLSEWVTNEKFFYSNTTQSQPDDLSQLLEIAGCGSSPLVKYSGTGAYFLDRVSDGIWRLEVMPDAYWVEDPYGPAEPDKQKAAIVHTRQQMVLALPNLGINFTARPVNSGNTFIPLVSNGTIDLVPGVYLLMRNDITDAFDASQVYKNIRLDEYVAPVTNLKKTILRNYSACETSAGKPFSLAFEAVSVSGICRIQVVLSNGGNWKTIIAAPQGSGFFKADVPAEMLANGFLEYRFIVETGKDTTTFPSGKRGDPWSWINKDNEVYSVKILPENSLMMLWEAGTDWELTNKVWNRNVYLKPMNDGETALSIQLEKLPQIDPADQSSRNYAIKFYFGEKVKGRRNELSQMKFIAVKAINSLTVPQPLEIGLIDNNGCVRAGVVKINPGEREFRIPLGTFLPAPYLIIPRPFPEFLPYKVQPEGKAFDWSSIETVQVVILSDRSDSLDLNLEKIWLE